jgi:putative methyltransferase (TIGR04325 family)
VLRSTLRQWLPAPLLNRYRRWRYGPAGVPWELAPDGFPPAAGTAGWALDRVADAEDLRWPAFLNALEAPGPLALAHEDPDPTRPHPWAEHHWLTVLYVAGRAQLAGRLELLDWGGGVGYLAPVLRAGWPELELRYHLHDYPAFCRHARRRLPDAVIHDQADHALDGRYDLVLASGSLHYTPDWRSLLARLANASRRDLLLIRLPTVSASESYVFVQRVPNIGYDTEFHSWCLRKADVIDFVRTKGFALEREFLSLEEAPVAGAPEPGRYVGLWFRRR